MMSLTSLRAASVVALTLVVGLRSLPAAAGPRYAVLIGANRGGPAETPLSYAVSDARRMAEVLTSMGDFHPEDVVVLPDPSPAQVRDTLVRLNARVRTEAQEADRSLLLVFYSGHADALSLHLGPASLSWEELQNLTKGSSATFRLLVVDACRSGEATKVKGTRLDAPFALPGSTPEGFAVVSSTAAGEDAQESEALQGSFFSHHLISALRGVGDASGDGQVTLGEAYQYAMDRTLASTARTLHGLQHPTYAYEIKGRADLVITRQREVVDLGRLRLARAGVYLLRAGGPEGPLLAEANIGRGARMMSVPAGRYFVQHRAPDQMLEGTVEVGPGATLEVDRVAMRALRYDALVRKGGERARSYSVDVSGGLRSTPIAGMPPGFGFAVGGSIHLLPVTLDVQVAGARSRRDDWVAGPGRADISAGEMGAERLPFRSSFFSLELGVGARKAFDAGPLSLSAGLQAGAAYLRQSYRSERIAPPRDQLAPHLETLLRLDLRLPGATFLAARGGLRITALKQHQESGADMVLPVSAIVHLGVGRSW